MQTMISLDSYLKLILIAKDPHSERFLAPLSKRHCAVGILPIFNHDP